MCVCVCVRERSYYYIHDDIIPCNGLKCLKMRQRKLEIGRRTETIQITGMIRSASKLRRILKT